MTLSRGASSEANKQADKALRRGNQMGSALMTGTLAKESSERTCLSNSSPSTSGIMTSCTEA